MATKEVPLRDAPECFFDSALWNEYLSLYTNREVSLAEISQPDPAILVYYRQEEEKLPWQHTPDIRRHLRQAKLKDGLVARFRELLTKGKLVATGFSSLAVERVSIPAERWQDLWPDFSKNRAKGETVEFTAVHVSEAAEQPVRAADLLDRCSKWMERRRQEGESRRKTLEGEATALFGQDLTTRTFAGAYTRVFAKPRGRPRKPPKPR